MNALRLFPAALLAAALPAAAQPDPARLPNLTPSVVTVEGDVEAALPQIERQPLSGFGPPPRTYVVPAEREPVIGAYAPDLSGLGGPTLAAPTPPALDLASGRYGRLAGGGGRFASVFGRFDLTVPAGPGSLVADVDYDGLGLEIGDAEHVEYARLHGRGGWHGQGAVRPSVEVGAHYDRYSLPGSGPGAVRRATGLDAGARVDGRVRTADVGGGVRFSQTALADGTAPSFDAGRLDADARLAVGVLTLDGAVGALGLGTGPGNDLVDFAAGGALRFGRPDGLRVTVGARALGYDASPANGGGHSAVVAPTFAAELPLGPGATLFARTDGRLVRRGLADLLDENPFVAAAPLLAPDVRQVDAAAGLTARAGALGLRIAAEGVLAPTHAVFDRGAGGLFDVSYERARILGGAADLTLAAPSGAEASLGVAFRSGRLTALDEEIPYFAAVVGHAGVQVPVAGDRGRIGLSGAFYGPRPTDRAGSRTLPAAGSLTFEGVARVVGNVGVVLRAERLVGPAERWEGFPQAPFTVQLGAQVLW